MSLPNESALEQINRPEVRAGLENWVKALDQLGPLLRGEPSETTLDAIRANYDAMFAEQHPTPPGVMVKNVDMGGIPGQVVTPERADPSRALLYVHGGGYVVGGPAGYHGLAGNYAIRLGIPVFLPDYRCAPEHPFPAPVDDVTRAYEWLTTEVGDSRAVTISGDSAGGAMSISALVNARDQGLPMPAGVVAISPWCDLGHDGSSIYSRAEDDLLNTREGLELLAQAFLQGQARDLPLASPVHADLTGLPPVLVQTGEAEIMLTEGIRLAEALSEHRVETTLEVWPHMFHVWHMYASMLPDGVRALDRAADFLRDCYARVGR